MRESLRRRHVGKLGAAATAERAAARGEHQPAHLVRRPATQALCQRGVFRVDRHQLTRRRGAGDQGPAGNQRLLVGQRDRAAGLQRGQRRAQTLRSGHGIEDHVGVERSQLDRRGRTGEHMRQRRTGGPAILDPLLEFGPSRIPGDADELDGEPDSLSREQGEIAARGADRPNRELVAVSADDVDRLSADGSGRTQDHYLPGLIHLLIVAHPAGCRAARPERVPE